MILGKDFIFSIVGGLFLMAITYLWFGRVKNWLFNKSLGQREDILRKLDLMFVQVDPKKVTLALIFSSFGIGALMFLITIPNYGIGAVFFCVLSMVGWRVPPLIINYLYDRRCDQIVNQMVDAMTIMANGIRSGLSITQSMERVVHNLGNPIRQEFRLVLSEIQLGRTVEEALNDLGERIPRADMQMFVTSVNILKETGGNMAETFQAIMFTVRERQKIEKKIEALTAQGIMQGIIISCIPFALLVLFFFIDPSYVEPLFTKPLGWFALLLVLGLQTMGGVMMRKIVKINV